MYFIGRQITCGEYYLLKSDVEALIFPRDIVNMVETNNIGPALRSRYEETVDLLLKEQGNITLNDLLGGGDSSDIFWNNPDVQSQNRRRLTAVDDWRIPLDDCTFIKTL